MVLDIINSKVVGNEGGSVIWQGPVNDDGALVTFAYQISPRRRYGNDGSLCNCLYLNQMWLKEKTMS